MRRVFYLLSAPSFPGERCFFPKTFVNSSYITKNYELIMALITAKNDNSKFKTFTQKITNTISARLQLVHIGKLQLHSYSECCHLSTHYELSTIKACMLLFCLI